MSGLLSPPEFGTAMQQICHKSPEFNSICVVKSPENKSKVSPNGSNSSSVFCRICHEGDGLEVLVSPCKCTGTLALIHGSCLEHWLTTSNTDKCEICKHPFLTTREPRSYFEYLTDSSNEFNVKNMVADIVCFFLLTPLLIVSTYLCTLGAQQYFLRERWEAVGLIILALFLLSVYYTWCHVTLKYHVSVWSSWQETNQRVRLLEVITNIDCGNPGRIDGNSNNPNGHPSSRVQQTPRSISTTSPVLPLAGNQSKENVEEQDENDTCRIIV